MRPVERDSQPCPKCSGTGNAGYSGHIDAYGCLRCGGCGYVSAYDDMLTGIVVAALVLIGLCLFAAYAP
jgi:DnaJ-class molecular chaperone